MKCKKYIKDNVEQCWTCVNNVQNYEIVYDDEPYILPYCKVMDMNMTHVYKNPCDEYKEGD